MAISGNSTGSRGGSLQVPTISIVTPSFNQGEYLEECIESILGQNYPNLEYVIMDGGSTDNSVAIIRKYEKYLTYWQSRPDNGQYTAITEGFRRTSGDVMAWLNSDDKYHPGALWRAAAAFSHYPEVEWFTGRYTAWDAQGKLASVTPYVFSWSRRRFVDMQLNEKTAFVQQESTLWRRSLWDKAGACLDHGHDLAGDFELWMRFMRHARLYSLDALIAGYRFHEGQKVGHQRDKYFLQVAEILEKERKLMAEGKWQTFLSAPAPLNLPASMLEEFHRMVQGQAVHAPVLGVGSITIKTVSQGALARMEDRDSITVVTSIAPHNLEKQKAAIASWLACGFRVVSLNIAAEIDILKTEFPAVEFSRVTRDGTAVSGKPLVYFDDILAFLRVQGEGVFGIVNSDIYLMADRTCIDLIRHEARGCLLYGARVDVKSLGQRVGTFYSAGFDYFFFDKAALECYPASNFMLGMPWWDYWAPLMPHFRGLKIKLLDAPFAYHVEHKRNYNDAGFVRLGQEFAEALFAHYLSPMRAHFPTIMPKISYDADINKLVPQAIHYLRTCSSVLHVPSLEIAAMNARGEGYVASGETDWAEVWFKRTLERDSQYLPAHNNLAALYWNRGEVGKATEHLGMALEIAPHDRITILNAAAVLTALGQTDDARGLYVNFLTQHPGDTEVEELLRAVNDGLPAGATPSAAGNP